MTSHQPLINAANAMNFEIRNIFRTPLVHASIAAWQLKAHKSVNLALVKCTMLTWLFELQALGALLRFSTEQCLCFVMVGEEVHNCHGLVFDLLCPVQLADVFKEQVQGVGCAACECDVWISANTIDVLMNVCVS